MSVEPDRATARLPIATRAVDDTRLPTVTREEAETARRHAAEIGDDVTAQRWHWHERLLTDEAETTEQQ